MSTSKKYGPIYFVFGHQSRDFDVGKMSRVLVLVNPTLCLSGTAISGIFMATLAS